MKLKNKKKINLKKNYLGNLSRIFLASLIIISFFFISPIVVEFTKNSSFVLFN